MLNIVKTNQSAQAAIACAISNGHVEAAKFLWAWMEKEGCLEEYLASHIQKDRYQWSLLGWAVYSGSTCMVDYILSLKLPEMDIHCEKPPVFSAAISKGNIDLFRHLIDLGADPNSYRQNLQTPLMMAVRRGLLDVVKILVEYGKADILVRDDRGSSVLDIAEKYSQFECAAYLRHMLLKKGVVEASSVDNFTINVRWFRPRILGPLLSARACALSIIIDQYLYITGGQGFDEGTPCTAPDNYSASPPHPLPFQLYRARLPALDTPLLHPHMPLLHTPLTAAYLASLPFLPLPKLRTARFDDTRPNHSPLAQQWSTKYSSELIQVPDDLRLEAKYLPTAVQTPAVVFARLPLPNTLPFAYFEVSLLDVGQYGYIAIGISLLSEETEQHLGWTASAYGCHADIGCIFHHSSTGSSFAPKFQKGDVVGCGIDFIRRELFYTVNGKWLGVSHQGVDITQSWHPAISMQSPGEHVKANFGSEPFLFDFVAPTLTLEVMSVTTSLGEMAFAPSVLVKVPSALTPSQLAIIRFETRRLHLLMPCQSNMMGEGILANVQEMMREGLGEAGRVGDVARVWNLSAEWTWKTVNLTIDPSLDISPQEFWKAVPDDPASDLASYCSDTHWFGVLQRVNKEESTVTPYVYGIEWATGHVSRVILPTVNVLKKANSSLRLECYLDASQIATWCFSAPDIRTIPSPVIFDMIREHKCTDLAPAWLVTPASKHQPSSSRLSLTSLTNNIMLSFGGFEEIAPQNTVHVLDFRGADGPKWLKPRIEGLTLPRARFFGALACTPAANHTKQNSLRNLPPTASDALLTRLDTREVASSAELSGAHETMPNPSDETTSTAVQPFLPTQTPPTRKLRPHLQDDGHDFAAYIVGGWNGWASVFDFDICHISLPKPTVHSTMNILNDLVIVSSDGVEVATAKILLFCRSSFFRSLLTATAATQPFSTLASIKISEALASLQADSKLVVSASLLRSFVDFWAFDYLNKSTIESIPNLLEAAQVLCPEHLPRIQDELFAIRMTHPSTLSSDFSRSRGDDCPIPYDMKLVPAVTSPYAPLSASGPSSAMERTTSTPNDQSDIMMHTYIAALKSAFFRAMIHGDFLESHLSDGGRRIVSLQTDHDLANMLVEGLCAGRVDLDVVGDRIIDLFELAHALQATELITFIEGVLCDNIDADNIDMFENVATDHAAPKLWEACVSFRNVSTRT